MSRINVYVDAGTRIETPIWWSQFFAEFLPDWEVEWKSARDILEGDPTHILFPGGSAAVFARTLGKRRRDRIRSWVRSGGSYIGVCAGAYLASAEWDWSLSLLPLKNPDKKWRRGTGLVEVETLSGPLTPGIRRIEYANGPVFETVGDLEVWAAYRSDLIAPGGFYSMKGTPAVVHGANEGGVVTLFGPHLEKTPWMRKELADCFEYIDKIVARRC